MVALQINTVQQMSPKRIPASHFLSKATKKAASSFALGGKTIALAIDPNTPQIGLVHEFKLSAAAARKLGRSVNVTEGVVSAITAGSNTVDEIKTYLTRVKTPAKIMNTSQFYFVTVRGRNTATATKPSDYLNLNKQLPSVSKQHFILGLSRDSKNQLVATIIHPSYMLGGALKKGGATIVFIPLPDTGASDAAPPPPPSAAPQPDPDNTQDFAACYSACMGNIPPFLLALAGATCGTCAVAIATTPISAPALAVACIACGIAIGVVLGNCLLNCHEML